MMEKVVDMHRPYESEPGMVEAWTDLFDERRSGV